MSKTLLLITILTGGLILPVTAQYYYTDILSIKQTLSEMSALKDQKIKTVTVKSFENDGEPSKGFFCEKKISRDFKKMETYTKSPQTGKSILTSVFNEKGLLISSTDSSEINVSETQYEYNNDNNLIRIHSSSHSSDEEFSTRSKLMETRDYSYNDKGIPVKMIRIRNNRDTTEIEFTVDEDGNVAEEYEVTASGKHYYYYYNDQNRLTDIVRYNELRNKAIPDFLFEYNRAGQLSQMIVTEEEVNNIYSVENQFTIWTYQYDGPLRIKEKCLSNERKLLGYFEYEYK